MKFQLDRLIKRVDGLDQLFRPFEKDKMDLIIKSMPWPDGFNGMFLK
jgi:hypothetical protein